MGRDPKYPLQADAKKQKKPKSKKRHESSEEEFSKAPRKADTESVVQKKESELPPFSQQELNAFAFRIEEKPAQEKKKSPIFDMNSQQLLNFVNGSLNSLRIPISLIYANLQNLCKNDQLAYKDVDMQRDDVSFINFLGLFYHQQLSQNDPLTQEMKDNKRSIQEVEREKRHDQLTEQFLQKFQLQINPRDNLDLLLPILPTDCDLRGKIGLAVFDNYLESVERNRFRYLKTLIPAAA